MFVLVSLFAACADDDLSDCAQTDWVGTYNGTIECDGTTEDVVVVITASGNVKVVIKYDTDTVGAQYDPLEFNACNINEVITQSGNSLTVNISISQDGNNLSLREVLVHDGITTNCLITASK